MNDVAIRPAGQKQYDLERRLKKTNFGILVAVALSILLPMLFNFLEDQRITIVKSLEMKDFNMLTPSELCPGDTMTFTYEFSSNGDGILIRDLTLWRVDPPHTIIYSEPRRLILDGAIEQKLVESWVVPKMYFNYETARMESLLPGKYLRRISVSSPTNDSLFDNDSLPITIGENCNANLVK